LLRHHPGKRRVTSNAFQSIADIGECDMHWRAVAGSARVLSGESSPLEIGGIQFDRYRKIRGHHGPYSVDDCEQQARAKKGAAKKGTDLFSISVQKGKE
jgi:hypothetical protein